MEDIWKSRLKAEGWSERCTAQITLCLADNTWNIYNRLIRKLKTYCFLLNSIEFPFVTIPQLADFMCSIADSSLRPASQIRSARAALARLYSVLETKTYGLQHGYSVSMRCTYKIPNR